jgi:hypothetical protein
VADRAYQQAGFGDRELIIGDNDTLGAWGLAASALSR